MYESQALKYTGATEARGAGSLGDRPVTPLQARLNDLTQAVTELEAITDRLWRRFEHLLVIQPPPMQPPPNNKEPQPVKSETSMQLDNAIGRVRLCMASTEHLIGVVEA